MSPLASLVPADKFTIAARIQKRLEEREEWSTYRESDAAAAGLIRRLMGGAS